MKEVKPPRKPLFYYYGIALVVLLLINFLLVPLVARHAVQEVDYGTFMTMTENKEIGKVEVEDNQIIFTNKDGSKIYKTGPMNDPDLTQRLYDAGAEFTRDIVEQNLAPAERRADVGAAHRPVHRRRPADGQEADGPGRRPRVHDVRRREVQCQDLCPVLPGHPLCRRGRRG